jgi:Cofilin/tropomyosin-type actin-binding protein
LTVFFKIFHREKKKKSLWISSVFFTRKKSYFFIKMSADISTDDPAIADTWAELTKEEGNANWLFLSHKAGSKSELEVLGSGNGGINEMRGALDEGKVGFGVIKVVGVDDKATTKSRRFKYVFVTFIGNNVNVLTKARVSIQKGQVTPLFHGVQVYVDIQGADELTQELIANKLTASGGAHKPTYYDFGGDEHYQLDFYHTGTG